MTQPYPQPELRVVVEYDRANSHASRVVVEYGQHPHPAAVADLVDQLLEAPDAATTRRTHAIAATAEIPRIRDVPAITPRPIRDNPQA